MLLKHHNRIGTCETDPPEPDPQPWVHKIQSPILPKHNGRMSTVLNSQGSLTYKHPEVVLRIMEKASLNQSNAEALFYEMLSFLGEAAQSSEKSIPTKKVDLAWHEFILFTKDYALYCKKYLGKFIHHTPTPRLNSEGGLIKKADMADCGTCCIKGCSVDCYNKGEQSSKRISGKGQLTGDCSPSFPCDGEGGDYEDPSDWN